MSTHRRGGVNGDAVERTSPRGEAAHCHRRHRRHPRKVRWATAAPSPVGRVQPGPHLLLLRQHQQLYLAALGESCRAHGLLPAKIARSTPSRTWRGRGHCGWTTSGPRLTVAPRCVGRLSPDWEGVVPRWSRWHAEEGDSVRLQGPVRSSSRPTTGQALSLCSVVLYHVDTAGLVQATLPSSAGVEDLLAPACQPLLR